VSGVIKLTVQIPRMPGKPEKSEYQALGYDGDPQVGQPGDIVTEVVSGIGQSLPSLGK